MLYREVAELLPARIGCDVAGNHLAAIVHGGATGTRKRAWCQSVDRLGVGGRQCGRRAVPQHAVSVQEQHRAPAADDQRFERHDDAFEHDVQRRAGRQLFHHRRLVIEHRRSLVTRKHRHPSHLYPTARTVRSRSGLLGSASSFWRRRYTCSVIVAGVCQPSLLDHTAAKSSSREHARRGCWTK